jgi:stress response protein YsnF/sporulation protein YlmC with PRC-barrel domain
MGGCVGCGGPMRAAVGDSDSGGDVTMTTQAEDLLGARVTGADGKVVGTVEQVFRDDVDGTPAWARVRAGKTGRFVPLGSSRVTPDGLTVPFDSQKILGGPDIDAGQHMSASQAEELSRYYGLTIPSQSRQPADESSTGDQGMAGQDTMAQQDTAGQQDTMAQQDTMGQQNVTAKQGTGQPGTIAAGDWLIRQEERIQVGTQQVESGRIRLHKYVDVQPVEQAVHIFHEEYDVERVPIGADEQIRGGDMGESVQEVILHEERAVYQKEAVPVERVRLVTKRVEEDQTIRGEVRTERIEIEPDQAFASGPGGNPSGRRK